MYDAETLQGTLGVMTLVDVMELSFRGTDLTWEDLQPFKGRDIGFGLYVMRYDIDTDFYLLVGDGKLTGTPMYALLCCASGDQNVDIMIGDMKGFVETNRPGALDCAVSDAIAEHYQSLSTGSQFSVRSYVVLGNEVASGTPVGGQDNYTEEITV